MPKILLVENINAIAKTNLELEGFEVDTLNYAPSEEELMELVKKYQAIGIRSKTHITEKVLKSSQELLAIGCFCIGTNQVDLNGARDLGIPVFNAPHSNTRSVAELVMAEMIALARRLGDINTACHQGKWLKSAEGSREIRGKTLGIVGYGHIGSQVSVLAESFGLHVIFYDTAKKLPLGNAKAASSLTELLAHSDFVTLHVPELAETTDMLGAKEIASMKKGSYLINASRGRVVVIDDLVSALEAKHLAGCAIDVYPIEPASVKEEFHSSLQNLPNVILTPHIGGSTEEAQYSIGIEVAESFRRYLKIGSTEGGVNFPNVDLPVKHGASRILNVHLNEPGVLSEINQIISETHANIDGQYLATNEKIGYIVTDVKSDEASIIAQKISKLKRSLKTRVVY